MSHGISIRLGTSLCFLALGWIVSACSSEGVIAACTAAPALSVVVTVRDSISGQAAADGAIGTLVGAGVDDTLTQIDSLTLSGGNQTGTFTVTIDRPGYLQVDGDGGRACHRDSAVWECCNGAAQRTAAAGDALR